MNNPPGKLDDAEILFWTILDHRHKSTGETKHFINGSYQTDFHGLVIAKYEEEEGTYLFYCDSDWNVLTDTYHESIEAAKEQAEFEFQGAKGTWKIK